MEIISSAFVKRAWRRKRYRRLQKDGNRNPGFWKIKSVPRLQLKKVSPIRMWIKLKNAYIKMMLRLGGTQDVFGSTKSRRQTSNGYSIDEFQRRLIYEISKNLIVSRELATHN
ncbi:hypothetical protein OSB04_000354 [Centaurea solstitialis]|uniref:Uncharacterized protein n=1 Tax=Centaurea solstitialis TaxID=347529 RepID=A0AA38TNX0_9ASTR|nr:hypothetical protein OSB04_000354 [Centaurea solstitialis]